MIFKFRLLSSEVGDFVRDIEIKEDQTFLDLHRFISTSFHYDQSLLASFFTANQNWEKGMEICLFDISDGTSPDIRIMDQTRINEFIAIEKQKLLYVFDFINERLFFIELISVLPEDASLIYPRLTKSIASPPAQLLFDEFDITDPENDE